MSNCIEDIEYVVRRLTKQSNLIITIKDVEYVVRRFTQQSNLIMTRDEIITVKRLEKKRRNYDIKATIVNNRDNIGLSTRRLKTFSLNN